MPRSYGRFTTSIWRDTEFTSLTLPQQAVYFTLGLQPEITAAGLLALTERRWAALSAGTTRSDVERILTELAAHAGRHVVVDQDTEELLIRKFIKWDGGWSNTVKRLPVVIEAVKGIASVHIRDIAVEELRKLSVSNMGSADQRHALRDAVSAFDRVVVTEGESIPQPSNLNQEGEPLNPLDSAEPPTLGCPKHPNGTTEPCGPCAGARRIFDAWHAADAARQAAATEAARAARRACRRCNDQGFVEDHAHQPVERCTHPDLHLVPAAARLGVVGE